MMRIFLISVALIFLTNCSAPGTALLGPAFTGATTKSLAQASMSFTTSQIIRNVRETSKKGKKEIKKIVKKIENFEINSKLNSLSHFHK